MMLHLGLGNGSNKYHSDLLTEDSTIHVVSARLFQLSQPLLPPCDNRSNYKTWLATPTGW
jgi:hypothetical protein